MTVTINQCAPRAPNRGQSPADVRHGVSGADRAGVVTRYDDILKSQEDKREYRYDEVCNYNLVVAWVILLYKLYYCTVGTSKSVQ